MSRRSIIYWLLPAAPERELFRGIIRILAKELDAPVFDPHVTLFSTVNNARSARRVLAEITAKPLRLSLVGVEYSPRFTKTLFMRFGRSDALNEFAATMQKIAGRRVRKIGDPHLSLCYKRLPKEVKREIASMIRLPMRNVAFDAVWAVRSKVPVTTAGDVKDWQIMGRKRLIGRRDGLRRPQFTAR